MKATKVARKADYQAWKKELNEKEKTYQEKDRADRAESQPQMIMGAVPFRMGKIKLPKAGIVQRAGSYREKAQAHVDRALQDRKHQIQRIAEDAARKTVAAELDQTKRDNETAAAENRALESRLQAEQDSQAAVEIDLANTRENNKTLTNQLTVLKDEHEELKKTHKGLVELFQPLIKLWNKIAGDNQDPYAWLDGVIKAAKLLEERLVKQPRQAPAPSQGRGYQGREPGD